ncbi:hypothetical protein HPP92_004690 [Vanilla planifolia]|uniref:SLH domain-containing protein n=1 Tax=Vanilla planifolia TaxID=51239 RepID=A0A835RRZ8_VANPL|nr:hypothetical protein HPP92_005035 [Vanilla planifolia]KAG0493696.1 hypothetical protein HPP92_004690 [Vanilla planifolia]
MASLIRTSPPCSLQLGSSRRCHEFFSVSLRFRLRPSRCLVFLAYSAQRTTGNGRERQSWVGSSSSSDSFGGWSGSEVDGDGKFPEKGGFGGMLGAGLAGVLFLGGITFATLSLSSKSSKTTSDMGVKKSTTALTAEQELQLISDDQATETVQVGNKTSAIFSDKVSKKNDEVSNFLEVTEDPSLLALEVNEDKHGNANHLEASSTQSPYTNGEDTRTTDGSFEEALQVPPGKILVPAVVDQVQSQALAALQVLKVIESDVQPGDLCTRREYARWLVSASSVLSRNPTSKIYPAMYVENVTELAFNDVTPEDPDFACIQGLAEAGIISSRFSLSDMKGSSSENQDPFFFFPESPVSRQDLVSWKMALEKRKLPEVDRNHLYQQSSFLDIDSIDTAAWPALVADFSSGEHGIICLAFGYTRLFQPNKPVTKAQAAIALSTGEAAEIVGEELARIEAESLAETAVSEHAALVAQVEKEINASFAEELAIERKKIEAVEKLAEEARLELERIRVEREEENSALLKGRAVVESEMEVLSRLRCEVEKKLQELMSNKAELSFERERISRLRKETESENQSVVQLQYELEVERKALSLARTWAEEEAKRARELAKSLEQARERWERHGIKVIVDENLQEDALVGMTWISAGMQSTDETINRGESLAEKLKAMAAEIKLRSSSAINSIIQRILAIVSALKQHALDSRKQVVKLCRKVAQNGGKSVETIKESAAGISSTIGERAKRVCDDCKESVYRISQKFKV